MPHPYKTRPLDHQREWFDKTCDLASFAVFWEMGTGKSKLIIDTAAHLFLAGKINGLLIVAPKGVAPNWVLDEIPKHMPDEVKPSVFLWNTSKANGKQYQKDLAAFLAASDELSILVMSYNAVMTQRSPGTTRGVKKGQEAARTFLIDRDCLMILDESARIKNPDTKTAKRLLAAGMHAKYTRVLTGTPVSNSPFDVYTQLKFLDPDVWREMGCGTFAAFKTMFGVWIEYQRKDNGRRFKDLVAYQNLNVLAKVVDRMGSRLLKDDVLDLPDKIYSKRFFDMCPEQKALYEQLRRDFMVWLDGGDMITAALAITRILRLQQVTSGYCPTDDGNMVLIEPNPRLACLMDTLEDVPHQAIVWAKFQKDVDIISETIGADNCIVYDGRVSQGDREIRRAAFKAGDVQYFVGNPAASGLGLTLIQAKTVIYYNSTYKLDDRLQSEDRAHRIGQDQNVNYIDIIANGTIDMKIIQALRNKIDLAAQVTGDRLKEWAI